MSTTFYSSGVGSKKSRAMVSERHMISVVAGVERPLGRLSTTVSAAL